jgi:hypothetical protein
MVNYDAQALAREIETLRADLAERRQRRLAGSEPNQWRAPAPERDTVETENEPMTSADWKAVNDRIQTRLEDFARMMGNETRRITDEIENRFQERFEEMQLAHLEELQRITGLVEAQHAAMKSSGSSIEQMSRSINHLSSLLGESTEAPRVPRLS